jgi:hypothetical protein
MALYKVRKGYTVLHKGLYYKGGDIVDLTDADYKQIPQLLEPAPAPEPETSPEPPVEGSGVVTEDVVMSATKNRAITAPRGRRKLS